MIRCLLMRLVCPAAKLLASEKSKTTTKFEAELVLWRVALSFMNSTMYCKFCGVVPAKLDTAVCFPRHLYRCIPGSPDRALSAALGPAFDSLLFTKNGSSRTGRCRSEAQSGFYGHDEACKGHLRWHLRSVRPFHVPQSLGALQRIF